MVMAFIESATKYVATRQKPSDIAKKKSSFDQNSAYNILDTATLVKNNFYQNDAETFLFAHQPCLGFLNTSHWTDQEPV